MSRLRALYIGSMPLSRLKLSISLDGSNAKTTYTETGLQNLHEHTDVGGVDALDTMPVLWFYDMIVFLLPSVVPHITETYNTKLSKRSSPIFLCRPATIVLSRAYGAGRAQDVDLRLRCVVSGIKRPKE